MLARDTSGAVSMCECSGVLRTCGDSDALPLRGNSDALLLWRQVACQQDLPARSATRRSRAGTRFVITGRCTKAVRSVQCAASCSAHSQTSISTRNNSTAAWWERHRRFRRRRRRRRRLRRRRRRRHIFRCATGLTRRTISPKVGGVYNCTIEHRTGELRCRLFPRKEYVAVQV